MSRLVSFASALLLAIAPGLRAEPPEAALDRLYGAATPPAYVKQYEADYQGKVLLNPYLQVASREHPAVLEPGVDGYKWVIDVAGRVAILREVPHPLGRTYPRGFHRPEDDSDREPGYVETYGHVSALGGAPGRIGGEILWYAPARMFTINNAYVRFQEDVLGSLEPRKFADLVVLDRDILTCSDEEVKQIQVLQTYVGGELVFEKA